MFNKHLTLTMLFILSFFIPFQLLAGDIPQSALNYELLTTVNRENYNNTKRLEELIKLGADVNCLNHKKQSPLILSILADNRTIFYFLLENGADPNIPVAGNHTPLHHMAAKCRRGIIWNSREIKTLADKGVDVNSRNVKGETPLMTVVRYSSYYVSDDEVETFLKLGADPNIRDKDGETALYKAVHEKNTGIFNLLIKYGADPGIKNNDGRSILNNAVYKNIPEIVKICINKKVNLNEQDDYGYTPLMEAARRNRYNLVKMLLEAGADPEIRNNKNKTALDLVSSGTHNSMCARLLIEEGADTGSLDEKKLREIKKSAKEQAGELLARIAGQADLATVKDLIKFGANVNQDYYGDSPLLQAIAGGNREVVHLLLKYNADPEKATRGGITPLMMMSGYNDNFFYVYKKIILNRVLQGYNGQMSTWNEKDMEELIDEGAKVNRQNKDGRTALMFAAFNHSGKHNKEKLELLLDEDADPNIKDKNGETALFYSVSKNPELFFTLVKEDADINVKNNNGETVLHKAAETGADNIISYYISKNTDINIRDKYGWTPLMLASLNGNYEAAKLLLDAGAEPGIKNQTGSSAIDLARIGGYVGIAKILTGNRPGALKTNDRLSEAKNREQNISGSSNPEFVVQLSHSNSITCMDLSSDGRYALTGSYDKTIRLWDIRSGRLVRTLTGNDRYIKIILFLPGNKTAISCGGETDIKLWDLTSGKIIRKLSGHTESVEDLHLSGDGKYAVSVGGDSTVRFWNIEAGKEICRLDRGDPASKRIDFKHVENSMLFPDYYHERLIRVENKETISDLKGAFNDALFSPDGKYIVSLKPDYEKILLIWDAKTFEQVGKLTKPGYTRIKSLDFSEDGKLLVAGTNDTSEMNNPPEIVVWDFSERRFIKRFPTGTGTVRSIKLLPDNKHVLAAAGGDLTVFSIDTGKASKILERKAGLVTGIIPSPDGNYCMAANYFDEELKIWNLNTAGLEKTIKGHPESVVFNGKFSPDGKKVTYLSAIKKEKKYVRSIITVNLETGKEIRSFPCDKKYATEIDITSDFRFIASNDISSNPKTHIWDAKTGNVVKTIDLNPMKYVNVVRFSPDGKYLAAGSGRWRLGFSGSGIQEDGKMILWDIETGKPVRTYIIDGLSILDIAFSPDGKYICAASGHTDRNIPGDLQLFDVESGEMLKSFKGHTNCINALAYSPDGRYIVSGGNDNTVRLWDVLSGKQLKMYDSHSAKVFSLAFTNDSRYILSGSSDGTMKYWNICSGRNMSFITNKKEWVIYNDRGYFDSSRNGSELVAMVQGMSAYGIDQFAIKNNRPDLILSSMDMGTPGLIDHFYLNYTRRLKRLGFKENQLKNNDNLPEVEILDTKNTGKKVSITFNIKDKEEKLHHYNVYVNDCTLFGEHGKRITGKNEITVTEMIELTGGKNKIEISAVNSAGAESFRALTFAEYKKKATGDLYFLGFGVSRYKNKNLNLVYAHKDATDLAGYFRKMKGRQFKTVHVKTYLNNSVTISNIKKAAAFFKKAKVDDTVVLFIAGHGLYDRGKEAVYYYLTHDADIQNLSGTAADFKLIESLLQGIAPRKKLFLIDTCESGEMDEELSREYFAMAGKRGIKPRTSRSIKTELKKLIPSNMDTGNRGLKLSKRSNNSLRKYLYEKDRYIYNDLLRRSGAIVFSSSRGGEFSYESSKIKNGFFTESILNALTGKAADKNKDRIISTEELRNFVIRDVPRRTWNKQHPTVDRDNIYQKFGFPVLYSR